MRLTKYKKRHPSHSLQHLILVLERSNVTEYGVVYCVLKERVDGCGCDRRSGRRVDGTWRGMDYGVHGSDQGSPLAIPFAGQLVFHPLSFRGFLTGVLRTICPLSVDTNY